MSALLENNTATWTILLTCFKFKIERKKEQNPAQKDNILTQNS
jgi:hypothetical protein